MVPDRELVLLVSTLPSFSGVTLSPGFSQVDPNRTHPAHLIFSPLRASELFCSFCKESSFFLISQKEGSKCYGPLRCAGYSQEVFSNNVFSFRRRKVPNATDLQDVPDILKKSSRIMCVIISYPHYFGDKPKSIFPPVSTH